MTGDANSEVSREPVKGGQGILQRKPLLFGAGIGLALSSVHFFVNEPISVAIAATLLAIIAGAYFGFAVADGRIRVLVVETASCLLFGIAAVVGLLWWPLAIPLAIICHGLWDIGHALPSVKTEVPLGYPLFCLVVDLVFGGILFILYMF